MRKLSALVVVFLLSATGFAWAADSIKIGYVDLQKALNESEAGKKAKTDLESMILAKQSRINEKINAKEALQNELRKQDAVLSPEAKKAKEDEMEQIDKELRTMVGNANEEMQKLQKQKEGKIIKELEGIIEKIGTDEKFTIIIPADVILYADDAKVDITQRVLDAFNKKWSAADSDKEDTGKEKEKGKEEKHRGRSPKK